MMPYDAEFQRWLEEDGMRSDVSHLTGEAANRGHVMVERSDCKLSDCTTHWECFKCGAMVIVMRGEAESSPSALAECGHDMADPKQHPRLAPRY